MGNQLLLGVQEKLRLLTGRSTGADPQWADTVPFPREMQPPPAPSSEAAADPAADSGTDSQYLTGFDSRFIDDPSMAEPVAQAVAPMPTPAPTPARAPARSHVAPPVPVQPDSAAAEVARAVPPLVGKALPNDGPPSVIGRFIISGRRRSDRQGTLYDAWDPVSARPVVVHCLRLKLDPETQQLLGLPAGAELHERMAQRALARARALVGLQHPYIATVHDAGPAPGGVYVAMHGLGGRSMQQALAGGWRPRPSLAARIMFNVTQALAHAHARGLVHGNLQPAHIQLDDMAQPQLLGLGLSPIVQGRGYDHASADAAAVQYLAPEQLLGGAADARTDVRGVGVVLYELLATQPAFSGPTAAEVTRAVLKNQPVPIAELRRSAPPTLIGIAMRAMATEPGQRYASAEDLAAALKRWIEEHAARKARSEAAERVRAQAASPRRSGSGRSEGRRGQRRTPSTRRLMVRGGLAALAVGVVALAALSRPLWPKAGPWLAGLAPAAPVVAADTAAHQAPVAEPPASAVESVTAPAEAQDNVTREQRDAAYAAKRLGFVMLDVSPAAQVLVNGAAIGATPPMTQLKLPVGRQAITLRSEGFDPYVITVMVRPDQPVELRHVFSK